MIVSDPAVSFGGLRMGFLEVECGLEVTVEVVGETGGGMGFTVILGNVFY
jgi:hypothetical protein